MKPRKTTQHIVKPNEEGFITLCGQIYEYPRANERGWAMDNYIQPGALFGALHEQITKDKLWCPVCVNSATLHIINETEL